MYPSSHLSEVFRSSGVSFPRSEYGPSDGVGAESGGPRPRRVTGRVKFAKRRNGLNRNGSRRGVRSF